MAKKNEAEELFKIHLEEAGEDGWKREYKFHHTRKWRFDFAHIQEKIAVEIEGGTWVQGRHNRGDGFAKDCEKYNEAARYGWRVYRFPTQLVLNGEAIEYMKKIIEES